MKRFLYATLMILFVTICAGCGENDYKHLTHDEAQKMIEENPDVILLDVRTREEFEKRHIVNALNIPLNDLREGNFSALPDKDALIMIYCWTGRRAQDAAEILIENDYTNVYEIGGIVDWEGSVSGNRLK
ncbi:MAG: rhodanese-like domain-containing protein [Selenomonadaceae bacterium]|nr:rhodanese-like domain-containing protein [Selenomonadaceae bacterium]